MTLTNELSSVDYPASPTNEVLTDFAFPFRVDAAADLVVTKYVETTGVEQVLGYGSGFTIISALGAATGTARLSAVLGVGNGLNMRRIVDQTQTASFPNEGVFFPNSVETALDRNVMQHQQMADDLALAVTVGVGQDPQVLPTPVAAAAIGWDITGEELTNLPTTQGAYNTALGTYGEGEGDALLAVLQPLSGAKQKTQHQKNLEVVSVLDFAGVVGDGSNDDTAGVQAAVDAMIGLPGAKLVFPPGKTYSIYKVNLSGQNITLEGYGATIHCTGGATDGAFYADEYDFQINIMGFNFTGDTNANGIMFYQTATNAGVLRGVTIRDCTFEMGTDGWGVYFVQAHQPRIIDCYFTNTSGGNGAYLTYSLNCLIRGCVFGGTTGLNRAIWFPGHGSPWSAGLLVDACTILNWDIGLEVAMTDSLVVQNCTIDYCPTQGILLRAQYQAKLFGNYLGGYRNNSALKMLVARPEDSVPLAGQTDTYTEGPYQCSGIDIIGNTFVGGNPLPGDTDEYACIYVGPEETGTGYYFFNTNITITNNDISFYTYSGVFIASSGQIIISNNKFGPSGATPTALPVAWTAYSDFGFKIRDNIFDYLAPVTLEDMSVITGVVNATVSGNRYCKTENYGQGEFPAAPPYAPDTPQYLTITHGCNYVVKVEDITLTPIGVLAARYDMHIDYVEGAYPGTFGVAINDKPATAVTFAWAIRRLP